MTWIRTLCVSMVLLTVWQHAAHGQQLKPVVEVEEDVYRYEPANNGSGPMWCSGSTCLVRVNEDVFASGIETLKDAAPLNNCRWTLFGRSTGVWRLLHADERGRTREPCPLACYPDGQIFLSANPALRPMNHAGPARPEILQFDANSPNEPSRKILPIWENEPPFTEHSYRSFAADGPNQELVLFQNIGYTHAEWAFRDRGGNWSAQGRLVWPWGAEYDKPQPIRVCYPNVALVDRAVYFCGVSDIVEPYAEWRAYKKELTGRDWDYDFRRLFFTWNPDLTNQEFHEWVEIASRDKTCGGVFPCDLVVAPNGCVHLLWTERAIDERLRERFFPDAKQSHALHYAQVRNGEVTGRRAIIFADEGQPGLIASAARFQVTAENRLFVFCYVSGTEHGIQVAENRIMEILADGSVGPAATVPLEHPLRSYFTATVRAGSAPSHVIDVLGERVDSARTISYARIRLW